MNLALGETWPSERHFSEDDFYNRDTKQDIVIRVILDSPSEVWRNNCKCVVAGLELRCHAYKRKVGKKLAGDLTTDYVCIDAAGKTINYPEDSLQRGVQFKGRWLPLRVTSELRESVPFIYIDVQRDYRRHSPSSRWTVLRRLFKDVQTKLLSSKDSVQESDAEGKPEKVTRLEAYRRRLNHAFDTLRSADFEQVEETLQKHALELLGLDADKDQIRLGFNPMDPENIFRSLQLYIQEGNLEAAAEDVGAGLQSAIVIAIFRTYQELQREGAIFAIEEPEVFLHPHRARFFSNTLRLLADAGNQVFISTHSPLFVPLDRFEDICLVRKNEANGSQVLQAKGIQIDPASKEYLRLITEFDSQRSELFFASRVMLVEGYTEKIVFPLVFKALGIDVNKQSISIIECQGKPKIPLYARILNALGIPFIVVHDEDIVAIDVAWPNEQQHKARERNTQHGDWNRAIATAVGNNKQLCILKPTLEVLCGLPKREDTKLQQAIAKFSGIPVDDIPAEIKGAARLLVEL